MSNHAAHSELTQAISWLALDFRVPADWEIVRHGVGFERGSLVFVDRLEQRLSVSWTACAQAPDLDRVLSDFENQPQTVGETLLSRAECSGFRLLHCTGHSGQQLSHALYFDPLSNRLIELEVPNCGPLGHAELVRALLASFGFHRPERGRCVRAFGVHAEVPEGFRLCASQVKPADVILEFERAARDGERPAKRLRIRRSGMARAWFDGDAPRAMRLRSPELRFDEFTPAAIGPHAAVTARGTPRGALLASVFGRVAVRRVTLWSCPEQNAVFETEICVPRINDGNAPLPTVWCCAQHAQESAHAG